LIMLSARPHWPGECCGGQDIGNSYGRSDSCAAGCSALLTIFKTLKGVLT